MKQPVLPQPGDLRPGTSWNIGPGLLLTLREGKHGNGDLKLVVSGEGAPTHEGVAVLLLALMVAEDRYRTQGKGVGAARYVTFLGDVVHWFYAWTRPEGHHTVRVVRVGNDELRWPGDWT